MNVLVVYNGYAYHIGTVKDHVNAFVTSSAHQVCICDSRVLDRMQEQFNQFDVIVLHYSMVIGGRFSNIGHIKQQLSDFIGYKALYIQDEYRWVDATARAVADLGVDIIYTVLNENIIERVYHHPEIRHVRRKMTLTGFVPVELTQRVVPDYEDRRIDVGYRVRKVPYWLGYSGQEKWGLGDKFKKDAREHNLHVDIEHAEEKRLYGEDWITFVASCKAVLGAESKFSFFDFDDTIRTQVDDYVAQYPDCPFEEVQQKFLKQDGEIEFEQISPRCFEAAALKTLMILYPGAYSGALKPWRHYVPLALDHSNMSEVVAVLQSKEKAKKIIETAYEEVALNPKYHFSAMVQQFDDDLRDYQETIKQRRVAAGFVFASREIDREQMQSFINKTLKKFEKEIAIKQAVKTILLKILPQSLSKKLFNS